MRACWSLLSLALVACQAAERSDDGPRANATVAPGAPARAQSRFVSRTFAADGITRVVLRAADASEARVGSSAGPAIEVWGIPKGGAGGYHSPDPSWKETPAADWGLDFQSQRFGKTLVISSVNEVAHIHHRYEVASLQLAIPEGVEVVREPRKLTGEGAADLSPPK